MCRQGRCVSHKWQGMGQNGATGKGFSCPPHGVRWGRVVGSRGRMGEYAIHNSWWNRTEGLRLQARGQVHIRYTSGGEEGEEVGAGGRVGLHNKGGVGLRLGITVVARGTQQKVNKGKRGRTHSKEGQGGKGGEVKKDVWGREGKAVLPPQNNQQKNKYPRQNSQHRHTTHGKKRNHQSQAGRKGRTTQHCT